MATRSRVRLATLLLVLPATLGGLPVAPSVAVPATLGEAADRAAGGPPELALTDITPLVAPGTGTVTVRGTVRNPGPAGLSGDVVVRTAGRTSVDRDAVAAWEAGHEPATGTVLGRTTLRGLRAGGTVAFAVTVPASGLAPESPWAAVPVSVELGAARVHTHLLVQRRKEYVPLTLTVALPLVPTPDGGRLGTAEERAAAWTAEAAPTGRLGRVLAGAAGHAVSWLVDPSLLDPPAAPSTGATATAAPTPTGTPGPPAAPPLAYAASEQEAAARTTLAKAVSDAVGPGDRTRLPYADPDVSAALADPRLPGVLGRLRRAGSAVAAPAPVDVAWPAEGAWSRAVEGAVRAAYGPDLRAVLVDGGWLRATPGRSPEARATTADGTDLLVADPRLSTALGATGAGSTPVLAAQSVLADTLALLAERPGTAREVLAVAPRQLAPDPVVLDRVLGAIEAAPWLSETPLSELRAAPSTTRVSAGAGPTRVPSSPLAHAAGAFADATAVVARDATVRGDSATFGARTREASALLTATSWRALPSTWTAGLDVLRDAAAETSTGLVVPPRDINFLADSGRIQIVVRNDLDTAVQGLRLSLDPESPRLRIDSAPAPLRIDARSRTTVTVAATALAAGEVPLRATLRTPDGTVIASTSTIVIRVTPTGAWVYWGIGALAALVLAAGLWRGRRRRAAGGVPAGTLPA